MYGILILILIGVTLAPVYSQEERGKVLPEVKVEAVPILESLTVPTLEESKESLDNVPGGTSLIGDDQYRTLSNPSTPFGFESALSLSPGVFARSGFGGLTGYISVRGSGLLQNSGFTAGVQILLDGMPITRAAGFTSMEQIDPLNVKFIEIYRGSNALQYGMATLGGAINLVSPTGYNSAPLEVITQGTSYAQFHSQISSGKVFSNGFDYWLSLSGILKPDDTLRDNTGIKQGFGSTNIGYRWNDNNETRFFFNYDNYTNGNPGFLTKTQLEDDPSQVIPENEFSKQEDFPTYRFALRHAVRFNGGSQLNLGAYFQYSPDVEFLSFFGVSNSEFKDAGFSARQQIYSELFGRKNYLVFGGFFTFGNDRELFFENIGVNGNKKGPLLDEAKFKAINVNLYIEDQYRIAEQLLIVAGAQFAYAYRDQEHIFSVFGSTDDDKSADYYGFSPKVGLIWQPYQGIQVFGNVSRSFEPPGAGFGPVNFVNVIDFDTGEVDVLKAQTATTIEAGTRGNTKYLSWELSLFHSWIKNELLTTEEPPGSRNFTNGNAPAEETGIELALDAIQPLCRLGLAGRLHESVVYTFSHFQFDNDPSFGNNTLPVIPDHFGTVEVLYEHPIGIYLGPTLEFSSSAFVDFANTLKSDAYAILGAKAGYNKGKLWKLNDFSLFVQAINLTDKHYAALVSQTSDAEGEDLAVFLPGYTRSLFFGVQFSL